MNCRESLEILNLRLDGELPANPPALDEHLAGCPSCRNHFQDGQRLLDGLSRWPTISPSEDLADRIAARVLAQFALRRQMQRRWLVGLSMAASILLLAMAGYFWWTPGNPEPAKLVQNPRNPAPRDVDNTHESLTRDFQQAQEALSGLTLQLADKGREQARLIWSATPKVPSLPPLDNPDPPLMPARETLSQAGQGVSDGLQTVAHSARKAVNFFVRELSPLEPGINPKKS